MPFGDWPRINLIFHGSSVYPVLERSRHCAPAGYAPRTAPRTWQPQGPRGRFHSAGCAVQGADCQARPAGPSPAPRLSNLSYLPFSWCPPERIKHIGGVHASRRAPAWRTLAPGGRLVLTAPGPTPPHLAILADGLARHIDARGSSGGSRACFPAGSIRPDAPPRTRSAFMRGDRAP